jgi:hypothetical protein
MIVYVNGRGMNAPELKAYISELEAENAELRAKVESAERQKAEYKRILKAAVDDLNNIGSCKTCVKFGDICRGCRTDYKWVHADEALALIGEEGERNG